MKPLKYYADTTQLDKLCERFGYQLDLLDRNQKLQIRVTLSYYILGKDCMGDSYSINDAWMETLQSIMCKDECIIECLEILKGITVRDAENLLVAIQAQCTQGNARLKSPVETTTADLVSRNVPYPLARKAAYIVHCVDNSDRDLPEAAALRYRTPEEQSTIDQMHQILVKGK